VDDSERIFTELIRSIERRHSEVTQLIRDQERSAVSRAEERLEQLIQEIDDLRRINTELEDLSHTHDHVHFLQVTEIFSNTEEFDNSKTQAFVITGSFCLCVCRVCRLSVSLETQMASVSVLICLLTT